MVAHVLVLCVRPCGAICVFVWLCSCLFTYYSYFVFFFFFSSRRRHTRFDCDWSSDVCSSDLAVLSHTGYQPPNGAAGKGRRSPDRGKWIPPGQVVVGCGLEKREAELQDGLYRRCDAGPAALPERGNRRRDVPPEIAYPAAGSIGRDAVNRLAARPLVEEVREVDAGSHRDLDGGGEPRVDLHQVRDAGGVPTELDFGVAFEVDFTHERFGVAPDVRGNGDALAQDRVPAQRRTGSLGPLGKARVHFAIRIQETHRFASSGKQWLEQRGLPEARHRRDSVTCLSGSDRELGTEPRSFPFVPQPRLAGLDHSRESDVLQCGCYISAVADDHLARDPQPEAPTRSPRRPRDRTVTSDCRSAASSTRASHRIMAELPRKNCAGIGMAACFT